MGDHLPGRHSERDIEMYLHLLLLISPVLQAARLPSSPPIDIEEDIIKQLEALPAFTEEAKVLFKSITKLIYKIVSEKLAEAENDVIKLHNQLTRLETKDLKFKDDYFEKFNVAKHHLRVSRQQLRELADRTVKEVGILKGFLKELDENNNIDLLKISINKMKKLMDDTIDTLKEAREEFNSALLVFQTLNTSIKSYKEQLNRKVDNMTATLIEIEGEKNEISTAYKDFAFFWPPFLPDPIDTINAVIESKIDFNSSDLENMQRILEGLTKSGEDFDSSIRGAIAILNGEIDLLDRWKNNAEIVKNNIDEYKVELLRKMKIIRRAFVKGLDDLEDTAEEFLARPIEIL